MVRIKSSSFKKHKKLFKLTVKSNHSYRKINEKILKAFTYSYKSRKKRLNRYRSFWIKHINMFLKTISLSYNYLMSQLKKYNIFLNRKIISQEIILKPINLLAIFFTLLYKNKTIN